MLDAGLIAEGAEVLARQEARFAGVLERWGVPPLWGREASLRTLVHIVLEQKVSLGTAAAVLERVDALVGEWSAERFLAVEEVALLEAGMSRAKVGYCRGLAEAVRDGALDLVGLEAMDDAGVLRALTGVRGIGPWTAGVYLTMVLRRQDAWPRGDRALAVGYAELWELEAVPSYDALDAAAEAWRPWRGVAARLLWWDYLKRRGRA